MKHLLITVGLMVHGIFFAQTDQTNLEKYWKFRNAFREKFVKIGAEPGESLPAGLYSRMNVRTTQILTDLDLGKCAGEMVRSGMDIIWGY